MYDDRTNITHYVNPSNGTLVSVKVSQTKVPRNKAIANGYFSKHPPGGCDNLVT